MPGPLPSPPATTNKTLLGAAGIAPGGSYGGGYPQAAPQPQPQPQPAYPQSYPSQPPMTGYPTGQLPSGYASQRGFSQSGAAPPVEAPVVPPTVLKKKASIARDVAIGVAIAGVVLGSFLAVKFFVLDQDSTKTSEPASSVRIATIRLILPAGVSAELFVDNKRIQTIRETRDIPVSPGMRTVKVVGPNGATCEKMIDLPAGKTTPLECPLKVGTTGSGGSSGSGSAGSSSGSAAGSGSGSAAGSGSGSAAGSASATSTVTSPGAGAGSARPNDRTVDKPADKPVEPPARPAVRPVERKPPPAVDTKGYLTVQSKPPARILVDNQDTGLTTPISGKQLPLAPGRHKVTFVVGADKFTFVVMIEAGATEALIKDLQ